MSPHEIVLRVSWICMMVSAIVSILMPHPIMSIFLGGFSGSVLGLSVVSIMERKRGK